MDKGQSKTALIWIWISILLVMLDQYSKFWMSSHLALHESWDLIPHVRLFLSHNQGAAFSFLAAQPLLAFYFFSSFSVLVIIGLLIWLYRAPASSRLFSIAITLIIGGAIGNLIDRIHLGFVVDFIDIYVEDWHWPTFNVADIAICMGAVLLAIDSIGSSFQREKS